MNGLFNVWNKWDPLKTVVLGDCYGPEFFRDIKNPRIRSALDRIATETKEDLDHFHKVLEDFGCKVLRPMIIKDDSIMNYIEVYGIIPKAPLQPRDSQMVVGDLIFFTAKSGWDHQSIKETIITYCHDISKIKVLSVQDEINAPSFTLVGKDLYVDIHPMNKVTDKHIQKFNKDNPNLRINTLQIGGHNDGCFHTLKPGVILSLHNIQKYQQTFPDWDVCYLPNQSWDLIDDFLKIKSKVNGKWWVPGEEDNDEFIYFVETWLQDWVGFCEESVFDVNVLMLDQNHVCVNNYNEIAFEFFKKHKIEPIIVPWRHRYFWDGGLHCITLDLYREGRMQDYFPHRKEPIVDLGFD